MNPEKQAVPYIRDHLAAYGIEWVNTTRVSKDFKFLIFGRPNNGKQLAVYGREKTLIRLEKYEATIPGVVRQAACPKSHAAEAGYSNFKNGRGVCAVVENTIALKKLLDWYFLSAI